MSGVPENENKCQRERRHHKNLENYEKSAAGGGKPVGGSFFCAPTLRSWEKERKIKKRFAKRIAINILLPTFSTLKMILPMYCRSWGKKEREREGVLATGMCERKKKWVKGMLKKMLRQWLPLTILNAFLFNLNRESIVEYARKHALAIAYWHERVSCWEG